jgi:NADP-dependent 3-hydroxy acid dehydrogenase YdfG
VHCASAALPHLLAAAPHGPRQVGCVTRFAGMERLQADDVADAVADAVSCVVTRPRHVTVNELLVRPTEPE